MSTLGLPSDESSQSSDPIPLISFHRAIEYILITSHITYHSYLSKSLCISLRPGDYEIFGLIAYMGKQKS